MEPIPVTALVRVPAALVVLVFVLAFPAVAAAHGSESQRGYVSTVERIVNPGGVEAEASGDGHFELTAPAGRTVIVRGYAGEPYLRFDGGEVHQNGRAPTAYINRDAPPPASAVPTAAPEWRRVATGRTYTWHDHRTHWIADEPPAAVQRDRGVRHHIGDWKVDGTVDRRAFAIRGSLDWVPASGGGLGWKWLLLPLIGGAVLYALFLTVWARRRPAAAVS